MKYVSKVVAAAVLGFTLAGCTGTAMKTQQYDASQYTVLGHSEASATGIMLLGVIPIGQNNRFVRAQDAAIKAKGGSMVCCSLKDYVKEVFDMSGFSSIIPVAGSARCTGLYASA